jgi:hypothetical protein
MHKAWRQLATRFVPTAVLLAGIIHGTQVAAVSSNGTAEPFDVNVYIAFQIQGAVTLGIVASEDTNGCDEADPLPTFTPTLSTTTLADDTADFGNVNASCSVGPTGTGGQCCPVTGTSANLVTTLTTTATFAGFTNCSLLAYMPDATQLANRGGAAADMAFQAGDLYDWNVNPGTGQIGVTAGSATTIQASPISNGTGYEHQFGVSIDESYTPGTVSQIVTIRFDCI